MLKYIIRIFGIIVIVTGIYSCSPEEKYDVLSFFFDGVPKPEAEGLDTLITDTTMFASSASVRKRAKSTLYYHPPYRDKECPECHVRSQGNRLREPMPGLCYQCHDDFTDEFAFVHGPVVSGFCTQCHSPHSSKYKKLTLRKGQEVCLYCHQRSDVFANEVHDGIDDTVCWECHNPHGGEDRFILN